MMDFRSSAPIAPAQIFASGGHAFRDASEPVREFEILRPRANAAFKLMRWLSGLELTADCAPISEPVGQQDRSQDKRKSEGCDAGDEEQVGSHAAASCRVSGRYVTMKSRMLRSVSGHSLRPRRSSLM